MPTRKKTANRHRKVKTVPNIPEAQRGYRRAIVNILALTPLVFGDGPEVFTAVRKFGEALKLLGATRAQLDCFGDAAMQGAAAHVLIANRARARIANESALGVALALMGLRG